MSDNIATIERRTPNAERQTYAQNIHVVLAVYDPSGKYSQHAGIVITSIFENTKSKVTVHILHDNTLTTDNRQKFIRTAEKYNQTIELIDVTERMNVYYQSGIASGLDSFQWTVGCIYRMLIPELLQCEKAIYLDCDIVVAMDIKELWDIDINNFCMAGMHARDSFESIPERVRARLLGYRSKSYINSGVLLMNLEAIRKKGNLFEMSAKCYVKHKPLIYFVDQDILNIIFYGQIKLIDKRFNNTKDFLTQEEINDNIIHTPGPHMKSWGMAGLAVQKLYWHYYLLSAWGENSSPEDIVDTLTEAARHTASYFHYYTVQCIHRAAKRILKKIFYDGSISGSVRYIITAICYRLRHNY